MINFIKKYTTGVPFMIFLASGALMTAFFIILYTLKVYGHIDIDRLIHVNFGKIKYVIILSTIWFIISDIAKKKQLFPQIIHFILDSAFYLTAFGLIIYFTSGLHGGLFPIFYLSVIGTAMFSSIAELTVFLIVLSAETYVIYFLTEKINDLYHLGVITVYVLFYFIVAATIKYFYKVILEDKEKYKKLLELTKESEIKAKINEEKYSELIESTPLCIKVFDENRKMIFLNKGGREEHFIKDTDDISKWDWVGTVKKEYQAEAIEKFKNAFTKGESGTLEFEHTPEGSTHEWCSSLISPIKDKDGKVKSVLFLSSDITALKRAELEAKQNEQMFKTLLDATPLCIKWFDKNGNLISINKDGREEHFLEKLNDEEIKKWDYMSCIDADYRDKVKEKFEAALKGIKENILMKHIPGTSKSTWCQSEFIPVKNERGGVDYMLFLSKDVTQEKLIEEKRKKSQERMEETKIALFNILEDVKESEKNLKEERDKSQAIISSIGEGLLVINTRYEIILINKKAEELLEIKSAEALNKDIRKIFTIFKKDQELASEEYPITKTFKDEETIMVRIEDDFYYKNLSGKKYPIEMVITPLRGNGITAAIIVFQDISREKDLDEAKSSFISIASHQLRTPLTSIRWYTEMLNSEDVGPLNENQKSFVSRVYGSALKLNEVINLLLSLARIESGKTGKEINKIELIAFTNDILKELESQFKQKNIDVKLIPPIEIMADINYDVSMLRQIVTNLLSNSIRYTNNNGKIEIKIEKDKDKIIYSVKDDGIGIPANQQDKIFQKFYRADNASTAVPDGSGLGLSLVKALIEMNKGSVWFKSPTVWTDESGKEESKGTTFYFTLPI